MPKKLDYHLNASLKHCLKDLIPVLLPEYEKLNAFSDEELKSTIRKVIRRELDHLHLFHVPEKALILHIEHQSNITEKLKQRMLLYAAMIYDKHPDKQLIQFVFYTGKIQSNLNTNIQLNHLKYHFPIIHLRNIPLEKFLKMNSLLAYSWGAASIQTEKELNEFYEKFVTLQEQSSDEIVPNAYGIVEDLLENNLTKIFEHLTKIAMTHRSRILDKLALEVAAPIIEKASYETYEKGVQEGRQEGRQEGMEKGKYAQALKTAENCLKEGMSKELVAKITELPLKTVQELAKKLGK
jgi:predicted transposase/invertase (TIGR01784 family)